MGRGVHGVTQAISEVISHTKDFGSQYLLILLTTLVAQNKVWQTVDCGVTCCPSVYLIKFYSKKTISIFYILSMAAFVLQ